MIKRKKPIARKTPLKRSTKPLKRKAPPKAKPATIDKNRVLHEAVMNRALHFPVDGRDAWPRSEMLVYIGGGWERCMNPAVDASHVVKRTDCKGAKWDPNVCVASCRRCHEAHHAHSALVMFPVGAEERAQATIMAHGHQEYTWNGELVSKERWIELYVENTVSKR